MKTVIKLSPQTLAQASSRLQKAKGRMEELSRATVKVLREAGEERLKREKKQPALKVPTFAQR
jgi:hypothetical protein